MRYFNKFLTALLLTKVIFFLSLADVYAASIKGKVTSRIGRNEVDIESLNKVEKQKFLKSFSVSSAGELESVIIYVESAKSLPPFSPKKYSYKIEMAERNFIPNVLPVLKDSRVTIVNSDHFFHNVHGMQGNKNIFMDNLPKFKDEKNYSFGERGLISIKCETHLEMLAHVLVLENPLFSKTDKKGVFEISNIPDGEYSVVAWHELMGEQKKKITVKENSVTEINFIFDTITEMGRIVDNN